MIANGIKDYTGLPKNIWILCFSQLLMTSVAPAMILIGGLLGAQIAPDAKLATLPLTVMIIGTASSTLFAAYCLKRFNRKRGSMLGMGFSMLGLICNFFAAITAWFALFLVGAFLLGVSLAFMQQFRFAALESLSAQEQAGPALSVLMLAGVFAAFLGPEVTMLGKDMIASPHGYAGSFVLLMGLLLMGMLIFAGFKNPQVKEDKIEGTPASLKDIIRRPLFIVALMAAAIGYCVMSFIMTATPISMHTIDGHSLQHTKLVIQSHVAAMFLPSLLTGWLINRFKLGYILLLGVLVLIATLVIGLMGRELLHYGFALIMLGLGWNFLFMTGTVLLPHSYQPCERFKVQGINDFVVFASQAVASLSAGWLVFQLGWEWMLWICTPLLFVMLIASVYLIKYPEPHIASS